jgi:hypothetical protein
MNDLFPLPAKRGRERRSSPLVVVSSHTHRAGLAVWLFRGLPIVALLLICSGCQTFSLSEEDFYNQQRGKTVDPQTGRVVEAAGTAGYAGAMIGAAIASALR